MIIHVVIFEVAQNSKLDEFDSLVNSLGELRNSTIPQIKKFSYGNNCSPEGLSKNYTHAFTMNFETKEDRDIYLYHPDHVAIAGKLIDFLADGINSVLVFDYEY